MALGAVRFLMDNLSQLLTSDDFIISGAAREELKLLKSDVALLESFLKKLSTNTSDQEVHNNNNNNNNNVLSIRSEILEVIYDIEDIIDACLLEKTWRGRMDLTQLAQQVRSHREDKLKQVLVKAVAVDFGGLQVADDHRPSAADHSVKLEKIPSTMRPQSFVGYGDAEAMIFHFLMEPKMELDVMTIVGMPGLGKTTLALRVFHNEKIHYEFPTRIWVHVSQDFNTRRFLLDILKHLTIEHISSLSEDELLSTVRTRLSNSFFLLVLDDVWTVRDWDKMSQVLPMRRHSASKVIITTREREVGMRANPNRPAHEMRFLRFEESVQLLRLKVFGTDKQCPPQFQGIGERIAEQCSGVPLALSVIGGVLMAQLAAAEKNADADLKSWMNVVNSVRMFRKGGSEVEPVDISEFLALSYNELPDDELKECFLYLGVFPEGYEISAWTLTRLWIAEGFVKPKERWSLETAAENILEELIRRSLLTGTNQDYSGQVKACRVGNAVRDFWRSKAAAREHKFFQEIRMSGGEFPQALECRRLCIHSKTEEYLSTNPKATRIRSFLCFDKDPADHVLNPKYISAIPDGFKLLRVLDSNKSIKFHQFPKGIVKLIHLRYITLSGDDLRVLPEAISQLWNLHTIVVDTTSRQLTVRANIWKMVLLRDLKTKASIVLDIKDDDEESENQNLQTLTRLSPEHCTDNVFRRARNLKTLAIFGKLSDIEDAKSLRRLDSLENLKLVNDLFYEHTPIDRLIQLFMFPPYLKRLTLSSTFLEWRYMSTIVAQLKTLEVLKLKDNAFTGMFWNAREARFRSLRFLLIKETDLVMWEASVENFPVLECLVLKNCEKLKVIPVSLAENLQKLDIGRLGKSAVESARRIKEEKRRFGGVFELLVGPGL